MPAMIKLVNLTKRFGNVIAVRKANLEVEKGEFVVLLGPSGCGKTTTLRCIAGLEEPTEGEIYIDGELVNDLPTLDRDVGFVFQHYALFPHMTAYANISFPLRALKFSKSDIEREVMKVAEFLQIKDILHLKPMHLSGGDLQSVALARALVIKPKVFLLDEPLSTLDAEFREEARTLIKKIHLEIGATTIYVTHDQLEAMAIADRIVTMDMGVIQQIGTAEYVYHKPENTFVANFIGSPGMNFIECTLEDHEYVVLKANGQKLRLQKNVAEKIGMKYAKKSLIMGVRPEDFTISEKPEPTGIEMEVSVVEELGPENIINFVHGNFTLKVLTTPDFHPKIGEKLWIVPDQERIRIFDSESRAAIL